MGGRLLLSIERRDGGFDLSIMDRSTVARDGVHARRAGTLTELPAVARELLAETHEAGDEIIFEDIVFNDVESCVRAVAIVARMHE